MALMKCLLITDHPKHIVSEKRFAKTIVSPGSGSTQGLVLQLEACPFNVACVKRGHQEEPEALEQAAGQPHARGYG